MDRHLKERLVGAAVLVAAAIILIPEMLSGPRDSAPVPVDSATSGASDASGVKTYTIDLSTAKSPLTEPASTSALPIVETAPAPPPEIPAESMRESAAPVERASQPATPALIAGEKTKPEPEKSVVEKNTSEGARAPEPVSMASSAKPQAVGDKGTWAVQVASFGVRATSERVAAELKAKGYPAFVTSFAAKGQTMYRVRVGPVEERAAAESLLKKIKPLHPGAAVVSQ